VAKRNNPNNPNGPDGPDLFNDDLSSADEIIDEIVATLQSHSDNSDSSLTILKLIKEHAQTLVAQHDRLMAGTLDPNNFLTFGQIEQLILDQQRRLQALDQQALLENLKNIFGKKNAITKKKSVIAKKKTNTDLKK
jgi:hypothetical protein